MGHVALSEMYRLHSVYELCTAIAPTRDSDRALKKELPELRVSVVPVCPGPPSLLFNPSTLAAFSFNSGCRSTDVILLVNLVVFRSTKHKTTGVYFYS